MSRLDFDLHRGQFRAFVSIETVDDRTVLSAHHECESWRELQPEERRALLDHLLESEGKDFRNSLMWDLIREFHGEDAFIRALPESPSDRHEILDQWLGSEGLPGVGEMQAALAVFGVRYDSTERVWSGGLRTYHNATDAATEVRHRRECCWANESVPLSEWEQMKSENERSRRELAEARQQLPESMQHCTILFKECEHGHGWLTAANWVQHDCGTCERNRLMHEVRDLKLELIETRQSCLTELLEAEARERVEVTDRYGDGELQFSIGEESEFALTPEGEIEQRFDTGYRLLDLLLCETAALAEKRRREGEVSDHG